MVLVTSILSGCGASQHATAPSRSPSPNQFVAAEEVTSCMRFHNMHSPSEVWTDPSGTTSSFSEDNPSAYASNADPIYSVGSATTVVIDNCTWPPSAQTDQTGFSQIVVTTVPGWTSWPGATSALAYADVIDTTCTSVTLRYLTGQWPAVSYETVTVPSGAMVATMKTTGLTGVQFPKSLTAWEVKMGYLLIPGESVALHSGHETLSTASCTS